MGNTKAAHHRGPHQTRATQITRAAYNNPDTRCGFCGGTLNDGRKQWGTQGEWEADHHPPGNLTGHYRPAHRHCNRSAGATQRNNNHTTGYTWP